MHTYLRLHPGLVLLGIGAEYIPDQYLWEKDFNLAGRAYKRQDIELTNSRGHTLQCSHYVPSVFPENTPLPCVIYCHGNSGCRADANEAAVILLPSNITVFTLDFSGSGLSEGEYVSLGWHEKDDLKVIVSYLRNNEQVSRIGLWGRSMGAVTSILYGGEDPSIAGMVLDSAFSNLFDLMMELVDVYKIRLPKFTVKMGVQYMRRVIQKKAKFDIMNLNCMQVAPKTFIPALFGHSREDKFIQPHHCDLIFESYAGDKNIIKFDGDHNSSRPQFYYDSVCIFFYNVLHPPQVPSAYSSQLEKYYDLGDLKLGTNMNESLLYEIITNLHKASNDVPSSSSGLPCISKTKSVVDCLSETVALPDVAGKMLDEVSKLDSGESSGLQDKSSEQIDECCSNSSSNRESWGRCSSFGGSDEEITAGVGKNGELSIDLDGLVVEDKMQIQIQTKPSRFPRLRKQKSDPVGQKNKEKQKETLEPPKKNRHEKFEKLEALSQRLRLCISRRANFRRLRQSSS